MKKAQRDKLIEFMVKHHPVSTTDRGSVYWYCSCGKFIDYEVYWPDHMHQVLKRYGSSSPI